MINIHNSLKIVPLFDSANDYRYNSFYKEIVSNILDEILPDEILNINLYEQELLKENRQKFQSQIPLFTHTPLRALPGKVSFYALFKYRTNAAKFFFEMISQWLIPGRHLNVILFFATDFKLTDIDDEQIYSLCDVTVSIENESDLEELKKNLPMLQSEICLGMQSNYYARRFLETKGLSADVKTSAIQEDITYLMTKFPTIYGHDLLAEMQHVLVICRDEFKGMRDSRHLTRIITVQYLFRNELKKALAITKDKRHLFLKIFRAKIHSQKNHKPVLALIVGMNFIKEEEIFEERHFLNAIQHHFPGIVAIKHSFFGNRRGMEKSCALYIEVEKPNGEEFTLEDIRLLRQELPRDLVDRIEHPLPIVFMPRNEEEIMRNILNLSNQIRFLHDTPQVIISFDQQTIDRLFFTIILVRVVKPGSANVQELFNAAETILDYTHDRSKTIGFLRKKYSKEANVFGVSLPKSDFVRRDNTIDLSRARQSVLGEMTKVVGEIRDFNGGMIAKQQELLDAVITELKGIKYNDILLENFFYSITPDVMRAVLDPVTLQTLFLMQLHLLESESVKGHSYAFKSHLNERHAYVLIKSVSTSLKDEIIKKITESDFKIGDVTSTTVTAYEVHYFGYLYAQDDVEKKMAFCRFMHNIVIEWSACNKQSMLKDPAL